MAARVRWHSEPPLRPEPCPPPDVVTAIDLRDDTTPVWALAAAHPRDVLAPVLRAGVERVEQLLWRAPPKLDKLECAAVLRDYAKRYGGGTAATSVPQALARLATVRDVRDALGDAWPQLPVPLEHRVLLDCSGSDRFLWDKMDVTGIDTVRWHAVGGPLQPTKHWGADASRHPVRHACCQRLYGAPGCWSALKDDPSSPPDRPQRFVMWWDGKRDLWSMLHKGALTEDVGAIAAHLQGKCVTGTAFLESGERAAAKWSDLMPQVAAQVAQYALNTVLPALERHVRPDVRDAPFQDLLRRVWELQLELNRPHAPTEAPRLLLDWPEFLANDVLDVSGGLVVYGGERDEYVVERNGSVVQLPRTGRATPKELRKFAQTQDSERERNVFGELANAYEVLKSAERLSTDKEYVQILIGYRRRLVEAHEQANQVVRGLQPEQVLEQLALIVQQIVTETRIRIAGEEERIRLQQQRAAEEQAQKAQQREAEEQAKRARRARQQQQRKDVLYPARELSNSQLVQWNIPENTDSPPNASAVPIADEELRKAASRVPWPDTVAFRFSGDMQLIDDVLDYTTDGNARMVQIQGLEYGRGMLTFYLLDQLQLYQTNEQSLHLKNAKRAAQQIRSMIY